jgi:hypothetical protein
MGAKARRYKKILRAGYRLPKPAFWLKRAKKDNVNTVTTLASGKIKDES